MKKILSIIFLSLLIYFIGSHQLLQAQPGPKKPPPEIETEEINVIKEYAPVLQDAVRIDFLPDADVYGDGNNNNNGNSGRTGGTTGTTSGSTGRPLFNNYQVPNRFLTMKYEPTKLRPLAWRPTRNQLLKGGSDYHFWLKGGYGNLSTPCVEVSATTGKMDWGYAGIRASHIESKGNVDFQDYANSGGEVFGKYHLPFAAIGLKGTYDRNIYHYYGYNHADTSLNFIREDLRQRYQNIGLQASAASNSENNMEIDYKTTISYNRYSNLFQEKENNIGIDGTGEKIISDLIAVGADANLFFTNYKDTEATDNRIAWGLTPKVIFKGLFGRVDLGASLWMDGKDFIPYPYISAEIEAAPNYAYVYGRWDKSVLANNLMTLTTENPFLGKELQYQNTIQERRQVGVKGNITTFLAYDVQFGQVLTQNQALFVNRATIAKDMEVVYDSLMTTLGGQVELKAKILKIAEVYLRTRYSKYKTSTELAAWHLPPLQIHLGGHYYPIENLDIAAELFVFNNAPVPDPNNVVDQVVGTYDFNLAANYQIVDNVGVFFNANNLFSRKYNRYLYYPTYGINILGGLKFRF